MPFLLLSLGLDPARTETWSACSDPSVDINATGSTLFTWGAHEDGTNSDRYATAGHAADPASSFKLTGTTPEGLAPTARINDNGILVIQHSGNGQVVTHHQAGAMLWVPNNSGAGFAADDGVDVDAEGNVAMVGLKPAEGVFGRFLDTAGPVLGMTALPAAALSSKIPLSWSKNDSLSPLQTGTDVYATSAAFNQAAHGATKLVAENLPGSGTALPAVPGTSYCVQLVAADTAATPRPPPSGAPPYRWTTEPSRARAGSGSPRPGTTSAPRPGPGSSARS